MADQLRQQALLEIALAIAGETDPSRLLNNCLPLIVRRSASTSAGVIELEGAGWRTARVTPGVLADRPEWSSLASRVVASAQGHTAASWILDDGDAADGLVHHVFVLGDFGLLVISRPAPFDAPFMRAFVPLAGVLARPLVADLERRRRQVAELDLLRMERQQQGLLDALPFAAWLTGHDGGYIEVNAAFESWVGLDRSKILGRLPLDVLPDGLGEIYCEAMRRVMASGAPASRQESDPASDRVYQQEHVPFWGDSEQVLGVVGFRREITEAVENVRLLEDQAQFQRILMGLAVGFANTPLDELPAAIDAALARTGSFAAVDRAYVFNYDFEAGTTSNTYEWCAPGIEPMIDELQDVPLSMVPDWIDTHLRGDLMHIPDVSALPRDDGKRQLLEPQGVQTLIALPLLAERGCLGFVGFDSVRGLKAWTEGERQLLQVLAELLGNAELRRQREAALLEARRAAELAHSRLELALQGGSDAIWEWDVDAGQAYFSEGLLRTLGRQGTAYTGDVEGAREIMHPDDAARVRAVFRALLKTPDDRLETELRVIHRDGHPVPLLLRGAVYRDDAGRPVRVAGTLVDLTREKQEQAAAARRLQFEVTIARISARFVGFERFPEAVGLALADLGRAYQASHAFLMLLDEEQQVLRGEHEWCAPGVDSLLPGATTLPVEPLEPALSQLRHGATLIVPDAERLGPDRAFERALLKRQGIRGLLAFPLMVAGRFEGMVGLTQIERTDAWSRDDLSLLRAAAELVAGALARSRTEQELVHARQQAEVASAAKTRFLSTISHELRTPMNGVLGMTELLLRGTLDEQQQGYVRAARSSASALLTLLDELLDISRIESGKLTLERRATHLGEVLDAVVDAARLDARANRLQIEVRIDPTLPPVVWTDPGRLRQVMANLVGNAIKFTPQGSVQVELRRIDQTSQPVHLRLEVRDTGVGIPEDLQPTIFEPFVQAEQPVTRRVGGTGLGLAIVSELVEMMGGTIRLESKLGTGTTVTVDLYLDEVLGETSVPAEQSNVTTLLERRLSILLAEDNPVNQAVFRGFLDEIGCELTVVEDGQGAIEAEGPYDIILMDCFMPAVDGMTASREIRAREARGSGPRVPILAVTADASAEHAATCRDAGMDAVLTKPFDRTGLFRAIAQLTHPKALPVAEAPSTTAPPHAPGDPRPVTGVEDPPGAVPPPVFDPAPVRALASHVGPDGPLLERLLALFSEHAPRYVAELRAGVEQKDPPRCRVAAHTLKSNAGTLGLMRLAEACRRAEHLARNADPEDAGLLDELASAAREVELELQQGQEALDEARRNGMLGLP